MTANLRLRSSFVPLAAAALLGSGCRQASEEPVAQNDTAAAAEARPRLPVAEETMDRAAILLAVAEAASLTALGEEDPERRNLDGRPFELRIRFGCARGNSATPAKPGSFNVRFDEKDRTLRVRAAPDLTMDDPEVARRIGKQIEAVEGFWMHRPWMLAAGCPGVRPAEQSVAPVEATNDRSPEEPAGRGESSTRSAWRVGIAQYFSQTDSRTRRRDRRAYEFTKTLEADEFPSPEGYDLVLSGRLRKTPEGRVISCFAEDVDRPPECVVSAAFDHVSIDHPLTHEVLAEWGS